MSGAKCTEFGRSEKLNSGAWKNRDSRTFDLQLYAYREVVASAGRPTGRSASGRPLRRSKAQMNSWLPKGNPCWVVWRMAPSRRLTGQCAKTVLQRSGVHTLSHSAKDNRGCAWLSRDSFHSDLLVGRSFKDLEFPVLSRINLTLSQWVDRRRTAPLAYQPRQIDQSHPPRQAAIKTRIGNHSMRATGVSD
jgi:hypothetical protein